MPFRRDLQILKGLSIVLVLCYHLKLPLFPSGYIGVDMFFVISGYLIAMAYNANSNKHTSIEFLIRRARRILPAYLVTLLLTLIVSIFLVNPVELAQLKRSSIYSLLMVPEIGFWMIGTYFVQEHFRPLLHFWYLGVQIQFYIFVPVFIALYRKSSNFLVLITFVSFASCYWMVNVSPNTSFFLSPFRLWEFLIGFLVAKYTIRERKGRLLTGYSWLGLLSIFVLIVLPMVPFPERGLLLLAPRLLASVAISGVLIFGLPKTIESSSIGSALVSLGKYSYSLYLAHFPIIILYFHKPFNGNEFDLITPTDIFVLLFLIGISSVLLYHLVESPFRKMPKKNGQKNLVFEISLILSLVVLVANLDFKRKYYDQQLLNIFDALITFNKEPWRCGKIKRILSPSESCELTTNRNHQKNSILLVGDSHADAIKKVFAEEAQKKQVSLRFMKQRCHLKFPCTIETVIQEIKRHNIELVVLHSEPNSIHLKDILKLTEYSLSHDFRVVLIEPVPVWEFHVLKYLYEGLTTKPNWNLPYSAPNDYDERNGEFLSSLDKASNTRLIRIKTREIFCDRGCQIVSKEGFPLYIDDDHLSPAGTNYMRQPIASIVSIVLED
jgi:peptidoglycan/LPS O-acetylase OafA/YrhL